MNLSSKIEKIVNSGEKVRYSGFYGPINHEGEKCEIIEGENNLFLDKGSEAPKILSCQHNVAWRLKSDE